MTDILLILSGIITICAVIPYIIEIKQGKNKPRIVSWFVWTVITGISALASLSDHQYATAFLLFSASVETMIVVILGFKKGDRKFDKLDITCFSLAMIGVILWQVFDSPEIAVIMTVLADFTGGLPSLVHSWKKPNEETAITYFLSGLGAVCTLFIITNWDITASAYPIFLVTINIAFTSVIIFRKKYLRNIKVNNK